MNIRSSLAVLLLLPAIALAQGPDADSRNDAWDVFVRDHGGTWSVEWDAATGSPAAIYGPGLRLQDASVPNLDAARRLANGALDRFAGLLGRGASTFVEATGLKVRRVFVFVYDQRFRGLPVIGGRADIRLHDNGVLSLFGARAVAVPADFDIAPRIDRENAHGRAHLHLRVPVSDDVAGTELVVWTRDGAGVPRLAWKVEVDHRADAASPVVGDVYVDAHNGGILEFVDGVYTCSFGHEHVRGEACSHTVTAAVEELEAPVIAVEYGVAMPFADITGRLQAWVQRGSPGDPLTLTPLARVRIQSSRGNAFTDANGDFVIPNAGTSPTQLNVDFSSGEIQHLNGGMSDDLNQRVSGSVTATPGTPVTLTLLNSSAPDTKWCQTAVVWHVDDANLWLRGLVGNVGPMNTISNMRARVNINNSCNAYYTNNSINFYQAGGTCNNTGFHSVIYHEWGHGLDAVFGGISQTHGLSEGWGDIMSNYRLNDPVVGRGFRTNGNGIRDARNSRQYPPSGGVHTQGQVWMGWAWDVREGLRTSLGVAAGTQRAEEIVVASIVADATDQPSAVREVFILDDDDGNLRNGTPNYDVLETASLGRNMPYPQRDQNVITLTHIPLASTPDQLKPRIARATTTGIVTGVTIHYRIGGGSEQTQTMVPDPRVSDGWIGLIPGQLASTLTRYYLVATGPNSRGARYPLSGDVLTAVLTNDPPPDPSLTLTPAQVPLGQSTAVAIRGAANAPGVLALSRNEGPTDFPGLVTLWVGAPFVTFPALLNGAGANDFSWTAGTDPVLVGKLYYLHFVQLAGGQLEASNKMRLLLGD